MRGRGVHATILGDLHISEYIDDYPTCERTYATLGIYPIEITPDEVTSLLGVVPTRTQSAEARPDGVCDVPAGWFLCSDGVIESRDVRRHIDWILDQIADKLDAFALLRNDGGQSDISCYWLAASHSGGPSLRPNQMTIIGELGLEIWFDFFAA